MSRSRKTQCQQLLSERRRLVGTDQRQAVAVSGSYAKPIGDPVTLARQIRAGLNLTNAAKSGQPT